MSLGSLVCALPPASGGPFREPRLTPKELTP
jgi:hypothetical protein